MSIAEIKLNSIKIRNIKNEELKEKVKQMWAN
jgi:hypothetical protein